MTRRRTIERLTRGERIKPSKPHPNRVTKSRLARPQGQPPALPARDGDLLVHQNEGEEAGALGLKAEGPELDGLDGEL